MANFYGAGIGFGSGSVAGGWVFQGDTYGYLAGGTYHSPASVSADTVDKFAIASDGDSVGLAALDGLHQYCGGAMSATHGYIAAGQNGYPAYVPSDMIQKYHFSTDAGGVDTCNMPFTCNVANGSSNGDEVVWQNPYNHATTAITDFVCTVQTATDADAANVACSSQARCDNGAVTDTNEGYAYFQSGSSCNSTKYTVIDRYQFGTTVDSANIGDISVSRSSWSGTCDKTHGYLAGGHNWPVVNTLDRFAFGSSSDSADVGDMTRATYGGGQVSSSTSGYFQGGQATSDIIQKYAHASSGNASNVAVTSRRRDTAASFHVPSA